MATYTCNHCHKTFQRSSRTDDPKVPFCSVECYKAARQKRYVTKTCSCCKQEFVSEPRLKRKYCSAECSRVKHSADLTKTITQRVKAMPEEPRDADLAYAELHNGYGLSSSYYPFLSW